MELELSGNGLANQVSQLVGVIHYSTLDMLSTSSFWTSILIDDDWHHERLLLLLLGLIR